MNFDRASASVVTRQTMRELDELSIAAGTASLELMERAGLALADALADRAFHGIRLPRRPRQPALLVLAGSGNNGGDGFVVARLLAGRGWRCRVALVCGPPAAGGDAAANLERWREQGGEVVDPGQALEEAADFDLALDAIFGTGLTRTVEGPVADFIQHLNTSGLPVVSADIPSGLCSDTGCPLGVAVEARATVTIGAAKPGLFLDEGPAWAGRVRVADIGLLSPLDAGLGRVGVVMDGASTRACWPRLSGLAHKGSRGHVLVVAGSRGKTGAAVLAARAALRAGAGLVTVASVAEVVDAVRAALPEAMTNVLAADAKGQLSIQSGAALKAEAAAADTVVIGPGLGTGRGADAAVAAALELNRPLVIDADGLNVIARWGQDRRDSLFGARRESGAPAPVLTPHPGEMGRLVDSTTAHVQLSRMVFADNLARQLACVVVLKGAATVVADGCDARGSDPAPVAFNLSGNPGMASAGMGDVLAGICGAVLARLADPAAAARLAVYVHGAAADRLARRRSAGFLAGEVADAVPVVLAGRHPR